MRLTLIALRALLALIPALLVTTRLRALRRWITASVRLRVAIRVGLRITTGMRLCSPAVHLAAAVL